MARDPYAARVALLVRLLPHIATEPVFALNMKLIRNDWNAGKREAYSTQFLLASVGLQSQSFESAAALLDASVRGRCPGTARCRVCPASRRSPRNR